MLIFWGHNFFLPTQIVRRQLWYRYRFDDLKLSNGIVPYRTVPGINSFFTYVRMPDCVHRTIFYMQMAEDRLLQHCYHHCVPNQL